MVYNLSSQLDVQNARVRLESLVKRSCIIELTEKRQKRTLDQNAYLHVLLSYFAAMTGNTLRWVKEEYYKKLCNPDLYLYMRDDPFLGRVEDTRSSSDLRADEMSRSIDRFRNWAAQEGGIYLPDATSKEEIASMSIEVERYKTYLY